MKRSVSYKGYIITVEFVGFEPGYGARAKISTHDGLELTQAACGEPYYYRTRAEAIGQALNLGRKIIHNRVW